MKNYELSFENENEYENNLTYLLQTSSDIYDYNSLDSSFPNFFPYNWISPQQSSSCNNIDLEKEEEKEYEDRYFISSSKSKEISTNEKPYGINKTKDLFQVTQNIDILNEVLQKKTKRGREAKKKGNKTHDKIDIDNIITVVQIHYINFIVNYLNCILSQLGINEKFIKIYHKVKKNVKTSYFNDLKTKKLYEILLMEISPKFRCYDKDHNLKLYEEVKDMEGIKDILNENYLTFFKEVYFKSEPNLNICINGKTISLSDKNLEMYNNKISKFTDKEYVKIFNKYVKDKYFEN